MKKKTAEAYMNNILTAEIKRKHNSRLINRIAQIDLENANVY